MKTALISELTSLPMDGQMPGAKSQAPAGAESFAQAISNAVSAGAANAATSQMPGSDAGAMMSTATNKVSEGRSVSSVNEKNDAATKAGDKDAAAKANDPDRKETGEKVSKAEKEISGELKEKLGVSDEELEEAMEVLGLTMADLFDPAALTQLYAKLAGAEDAMSILTDEGMYAGLQDLLSDVQTLTQELMDSLGVNEEELKAIVGDFVVPEEVQEVAEDPGITVSAEDEPEDEGVAVVKEVREENTDPEAGAQTNEAAGAADEQTVSRRNRTGRESERHGSDDAMMGQTGNIYNNTNTVNEAAPEVTFENTSYSGEQTREIARQLVEQIRVNVTQETTSLDMVLNPASLGHVALNIEARNGVITASFTAQNEAVRAVIENQMVILRENLESQGIRIEAVEVTVSSQAFDQNLERGREEDRQRDEAFHTVRASGRRHQINLLSEDEEDAEPLSEEEEINRDMMMRSGNTMDVTA